MDEFEITSIVRDKTGAITYCCVKGYGIQNIGLIAKLILEDACSFFVLDEKQKREVFARTSPKGEIFLTTNPNGYDMNSLNLLPVLDKPLLRRLIEPAR